MTDTTTAAATATDSTLLQRPNENGPGCHCPRSRTTRLATKGKRNAR